MRRVICCFALFSLGCTPSGDVGDDAPPAAVPSPDDPLARGSVTQTEHAIVTFVNDGPLVDFRVLDDEVRLDRRAAESIIVHRDGPDGTFGTSDDDLFDSVQEIDDQFFVGPVALQLLADYVADSPWMPGDNERAGVIEGVEFTWVQLTETLRFANEGTETQLDVDAELDRRAVDSILEARPIASVPDLAELFFVGEATLRALRDFATSADWRTLSGEEGPCDVTADCDDGLVCLGEYAYGGGGFCVDESLAGTFTSTTEIAIPDGDATGITSSIEVSGLASVPVDIVVRPDIRHFETSDLVVTLEDPNGVIGEVWTNTVDPKDEVIVRGIPSDDEVNGTWTLRVVDEVAKTEGTLQGWELYLVSIYD